MKDYKVDKASLSASFCQEVYQVVREIPVGKVSTSFTLFETASSLNGLEPMSRLSSSPLMSCGAGLFI